MSENNSFFKLTLVVFLGCVLSWFRRLSQQQNHHNKWKQIAVLSHSGDFVGALCVDFERGSNNKTIRTSENKYVFNLFQELTALKDKEPPSELDGDSQNMETDNSDEELCDLCGSSSDVVYFGDEIHLCPGCLKEEIETVDGIN